MLKEAPGTMRNADLIMLDAKPANGSLVSRFVRGQNFLVEWIEVAGAASHRITSDDETILLLFDASAEISGAANAAPVPRRSVAILPGGDYDIHLKGPGRGCVLSTSRKGSLDAPANAPSYVNADPRVAPVGSTWKRVGDPKRVQIFEIDQIRAPADNPRLKMFQRATMSINWVDYKGPRDRKTLSPHSHADFEQASLAAAGNFVHHLRTAWGKNATEWRDDEHRLAGSPSILVIPPDLIHTTEGVGEGDHLLIDIFAPPRRDFIAKNWVANSAEYLDPLKQRR
ncbi:MAG: hypothetical protein ACXWJT_13435 [Xanthobacteraceae bacterium]